MTDIKIMNSQHPPMIAIPKTHYQVNQTFMLVHMAIGHDRRPMPMPMPMAQ